ncbi:MAG: hypothetical protein EAZ89_07370 [Bacteroidetes bacterium]|nr:MAG: hypothetical protein EAZ89_07370 [Bacteroidota bacterium]
MKATFTPQTALLLAALLLVSTSACRKGSPEDIPKYKNKFRAQITSFENQKIQADEKVEDGVNDLEGLQKALQNAKSVDQEFNRVYTKWEQVNKQVEDLNKEYEGLKADAQNLFDAMERQTASLSDAKTRSELQAGIRSTRAEYEKTLVKTSKAIEQLRGVHKEAVEVVKALEVAVALGQISKINQGLVSIESRVQSVMADLNASVAESKQLYENRIGNL